MKITNSITITLFFLLITSLSMFAQNKGQDIAVLSKKSDAGYKSVEVDLKMILTNQQGQSSTNLLNNKILEMSNDGDKSIIEFNSPKDVKGTKTLTYTHKKGDDDQWIYLPAVSRVKRISSSNKSGPFMGSEFAFEDLSSFEVEKFTYKYIGEESMNGSKVAEVEMYPTDPKSGYSKRVTYFNLDKNNRVEKIEYYDRKKSKLKTMTYNAYKQYQGKHWRASSLEMVNHQNGKKTTLEFNNYKFNIAISENDLTEQRLSN